MTRENASAWEDLGRGARLLCRRVRELVEAGEGGLKEVKELTSLAKDAAGVLKALEEQGGGENGGGVIEIGKAKRTRRKREAEE